VPFVGCLLTLAWSERAVRLGGAHCYVDVLDKVPSFDAEKTARRSSSSLDNNLPPPPGDSMQQVPRGCLVAFLGAMALISDTLFVGGLLSLQSHGDRIVCGAFGCRTMLVPMIVLGLFGGLTSLGFLGALLSKGE
jgi:hypothetical protein